MHPRGFGGILNIDPTLRGPLPLDVWIGGWKDPGARLAVSFEPERFYWFLYPLIERLRDAHGKYLDLYGGCEFEPHELPIARQFVADAEALARRQPDLFRVVVGNATGRDIHEEIRRDALLQFLASLEAAIDQCAATGTSLHFYGD